MIPEAKVILLLAVFLATAAGDCSTLDFEGKYARCQSLNPLYDIYWNVEGNDLHILAHLRMGNAWLGLGTSVNGGMRGADIAVARQVNGKYVLEDRFVPGVEGEPKVDDHQDVELISATSDDSSTTIEFKRSITPCDVDEDVAIPNHATPVIFAYGISFGYHGQNRGSVFVSFLSVVPPPAPLPSDAQAQSLLFPSYAVPARETTYACTTIEFGHTNRSQIVRWRPKITPGNEPYVHHMVLFSCTTKLENTEPFDCIMAPPECIGFLLAWSLGQPGQDWSDDYALLLSEDTRYGVLQVHYNNPGIVSGVVDNSGVEIYYTQQLKKYDIGNLFLVYDIPSVVIPPHTTDTTVSVNYCATEFPSPVTLVGYFPHMHQIGQEIWTQHIRNGTELAEVHRDNHYDFQRQQTYPVSVPLLPGDRLISHCVWNSMTRDNVTTGGESSSQEMCVVIIQYYPQYYGSKREITADCANEEYTALPAPESTCSVASTNHDVFVYIIFVFALLLLCN